MCRIASLFLLQRLKEITSGVVRDFEHIETRDIIKFFLPERQGAEGNSSHSDRNIREHAPSYSTVKTGWPSLSVVIFPPVMRLVLDDPKE